MLISTIFTTNYIILRNLPTSIKIPDIFIYIIILSFISFIIGFTISVYSSKKNCDKMSYLIAIKNAFKHVFYSIFAYFIIYFVSFVRNPFLELFGKNALGYSIAQSFIIILNTTISVIINYYDSMKQSCKVPQSVIDKNLKKLDKYLNKKPNKKQIKTIEIKD